MAIHFDNEKDQGIYDYTGKLEQPAVAVFDIGTHGARILVAPQVIPSKWPHHTFRLVGDEFGLGASVDPKSDVLKPDDPTFRRLLQWINIRTKTLRRCGVTDISIIGTAIFRWLDNRDEIITAVKRATGLTIDVVPEYREAELTFRSLPLLLQVGEHPFPIADDDIVVLLDQGGGSTEISWMRWGARLEPKPTPDLRLYDELGTVALKSLFFERNAKGEFIEPKENATGIEAQLQRVRDHVERVASAWRGGPKKREDNKVFVFGLGSALSKIVSGNNLATRHLKRLDRKYIEEQIRRSLEDLSSVAGDIKRVQRLYALEQELKNNRSNEAKKEAKKLDESLLRLYGLPAIVGLLDRCRVDHLYFSSYGLAYGYYVDRYADISQAAPPVYEGNNPYVFISYSHMDKSIAYRVISEMQALGFRVWYDQGMVGGQDWQDVVANKIAACGAFLVLMSPDANASRPVKKELDLAQRREKQIVDFRVRPTALSAEFEIRLSSAVYINWDAIDRKYLSELERALPEAARTNVS